MRNGKEIDPLDEDWLDDDCMADDEDFDEMSVMQLDLPMREENYATGSPRITVDYFEFDPPRREAIAQALLALDLSMLDTGADLPRILYFEKWAGDDAYDPRDLIAIFTVREAVLRVETGRSADTGPIRRLVEDTLGDGLRHLRRVAENPFEDLEGG